MMKWLTTEECRELEFRYVPNGEKYLLWSFSHSRIGTVLTRGRTAEEALEYIHMTYSKCDGWVESTSISVAAAKYYESSLRQDECPFANDLAWLDHPPVCILKKIFGVKA